MTGVRQDAGEMVSRDGQSRWARDMVVSRLLFLRGLLLLISEGAKA